MPLSPLVRFGTSTWTYEGWKGDVYKREYHKGEGRWFDSLKFLHNPGGRRHTTIISEAPPMVSITRCNRPTQHDRHTLRPSRVQDPFCLCATRTKVRSLIGVSHHDAASSYNEVLRKGFYACLEAAGLRRICFHDLRPRLPVC